MIQGTNMGHIPKSNPSSPTTGQRPLPENRQEASTEVPATGITQRAATPTLDLKGNDQKEGKSLRSRTVTNQATGQTTPLSPDKKPSCRQAANDIRTATGKFIRDLTSHKGSKTPEGLASHVTLLTNQTEDLTGEATSSLAEKFSVFAYNLSTFPDWLSKTEPPAPDRELAKTVKSYNHYKHKWDKASEHLTYKKGKPQMGLIDRQLLKKTDKLGNLLSSLQNKHTEQLDKFIESADADHGLFTSMENLTEQLCTELVYLELEDAKIALAESKKHLQEVMNRIPLELKESQSNPELKKARLNEDKAQRDVARIRSSGSIDSTKLKTHLLDWAREAFIAKQFPGGMV